MTPSDPDPKEYTISVRTDDVHEAISSVSSALYALVEEALGEHENYEAEECEFEAFARDVLGVLTRHSDQLSGSGSPMPMDTEDNYG